MVVFENVKFKNINSVGNYFVDIPLNKYKNTVFVGENGTGKCFYINTIVRVKNKKTNEIKEITIGELYDKAKQNGTRKD